MPEPNLITVLRGLKVRVSTMDAFLIANGKPHGTDGSSFVPFYDGDKPDEISALLRAKAGSDEILYVVPSVEGHDRSSHVYVACSYLHVYAQRCITANEPADRIPEGFRKLLEEILKFGGHDEEGLVGLFVIYTEERSGPDPPELEERYKASIEFRPCDVKPSLFGRSCCLYKGSFANGLTLYSNQFTAASAMSRLAIGPRGSGTATRSTDSMSLSILCQKMHNNASADDQVWTIWIYT